MCGRFVRFSKKKEIQKHYNIDKEFNFNCDVSYNVSPSQNAPVIIWDQDGLTIDHFSFGWFSVSNQMINARGESVFEKNLFSSSIRKRRCLIPANGFYEWNKDKQPYYFHLNDQPLFSLAGIWKPMTVKRKMIFSFLILTIEANDSVKSIHKRMPVVINPSHEKIWLKGKTTDNELKTIIHQSSSLDFVSHSVSKNIGKVEFNEPKCIEHIKVLKENNQSEQLEFF